ncbi:hypothetical protein PRUPE_8G211900 [Prunus persica]|uniref:phosphopyruvate hydratase n=1 Tax=Prunus persica TaxID=3760 RepID=M5VI42_PRUPE|nr:hypothetical protein PRUPE_8G211900 [Prunus persica]
MVSHCRGEIEDNFTADLSVGLASGQVYITGAPWPSTIPNTTHFSKFSLLSQICLQLLLIEVELDNVCYAGEAFRSP